MLTQTLAAIAAVALILPFYLFVKKVHIEGDHVTYLVVAPEPSVKFNHGGGKEGAWRRAHPGQTPPWWLRGDYVVLMETTGW